MRELRRGRRGTKRTIREQSARTTLRHQNVSSRASEDGEGSHIEAMDDAPQWIEAQRASVRSFGALRQPQDDTLIKRVVGLRAARLRGGLRLRLAHGVTNVPHRVNQWRRPDLLAQPPDE